MAKTFFGGIATILPLFILTSELIAISTSFRCFYTCLTQDLVAANSSKSFVGESGQPSGSQLLFPGWESGLGLESREVSHQNRELTKDLKDPVPGLSAVGGTQKLDRCRRSLRESLPRSFPLKVPSSKNVDSHTQPKVKWLSPPNMTCVGQKRHFPESRNLLLS